jgi:hypothetical protein
MQEHRGSGAKQQAEFHNEFPQRGKLAKVHQIVIASTKTRIQSADLKKRVDFVVSHGLPPIRIVDHDAVLDRAEFRLLGAGFVSCGQCLRRVRPAGKL